MTVQLVKITRDDMTTHGGFLWERGHVRVIPPARRRPVLCSGGVFHAYLGVEQALLMNPGQANYRPPQLWTAEAPEIIVTDGTKVGTYELTLGDELPLPTWWLDETQQRRVQVRFAVLCARAVLSLYEDKYPNDERPRKAIEAAENYLAGKPAAADADAAVAAARAAAAYAAYAAAAAAYAAARAAAAHSQIDTHALACEAVRLESEVPA